MSANFKPQRTTAASRGFLAIAWLSCYCVEPVMKKVGVMDSENGEDEIDELIDMCKDQRGESERDR